MYTSRDVLIQKTSDQLCKYWVLMTTNKIIRISNNFPCPRLQIISFSSALHDHACTHLTTLIHCFLAKFFALTYSQLTLMLQINKYRID